MLKRIVMVLVAMHCTGCTIKSGPPQINMPPLPKKTEIGISPPDNQGNRTLVIKATHD